jgi:hypothetical protein
MAGATRFEDLLSWQRMHELNIEVWKGLIVGYFKLDDFDRLDSLADRGLQAVAKFQRYLRSPEAKRNAARRYRPKWTAKPKNDPNENDPNARNGPNGSNDENDPNGSNDPNDPNGSNVPND